MSIVDNLKNRININPDNSNQINSYDQSFLNNMQQRLNPYGGKNQWVRMRQDKLRSLKKALRYSYQSAIVQKYDVKKETLVSQLITIITKLQNIQTLSENELVCLKNIEQEYKIVVTENEERYQLSYISQINDIIDDILAENSAPCFRCLINHDKLKVEYEDKIISIPFEDIPIGGSQVVETGFHNGTVFKWIHGNKQEWTPDTYWIVYVQYSEETAYFRAEIRKADQQIQIVTIDEEGNQSSSIYRGWMTGPNETTALWNTKKGITWNDLNYTKLLYITKDQNTLAFFQRFDRIIINGKPWEVQAYNENYTTNKSPEGESGIIRVALKETYTGSDQFVREELAKMANEEAEGGQKESSTQAYIAGPALVKPYDIITFKAKGFENNNLNWTLYDTSLAKIVKTSEDNLSVTVEILTGISNQQGFYINYGDSEDTKINVKIESF